MSVKPAILLVDDEPDLLRSLVGLLRRDFDVHTAESGDEALKIMSERPIHVLMTDQRMPSMTGSELIQTACHEYPATTQILFTGYADIKSVIEAVNTGRLYRYITKPWDPEELVEVLREAAREYNRLAIRQRLVAEVRRLVAEGRQIAEQLQQNANGTATETQCLLESFVDSGINLADLLDRTYQES